MSTNLPEAVICEPVRTPVGRFGGSFKDVAAHTLGAGLLRALIERTGLPHDVIDEVILGNCYPSMDAPAIGRVVALDAGLPITVPGLQIDRRCGSSLQAVIDATMRVRTGAADLVIAGGVESMSRAPFYSTEVRYGISGDSLRMHDSLARGRVTAGGVNHPVPGGMIETAERLRAEYNISRTAQDELSLRSHERAIAAQDAGIFADEVIPVTVSGRKGDVLIDTDEHPRRGLTIEALAKLKPLMSADPDSTVTAGNASGQNDGASLCIVTTPQRAAELGLRPFARFVDWAVAGVPPRTMGIGPVPAVAKLLAKQNLTLADMDLIELNEAFAAQVLACTTEWGYGDVDHPMWDRTNVHGSGIALGHPVGATGVRLLTTMLRELERRDGRYGLETMCIGGGQGLAALFERV